MKASYALTILIILILPGSFIYAVLFYFSGWFWVKHNPWTFTTNSVWNAGLVSFDRSSARLDGTSLVGDFTIETIGKVSFKDARIIAPSSGKVTDLWGVFGSASSKAGTISLDHVYYDPIGKGLVGYGMNHGIGKIPFWNPVITDPITGKLIVQSSIDPTTWLPNNTPITTDGISTGFEWRVKVLGNIGGNSAFATFYSPGIRFNASLYNSTLNQMRKNIAFLTRNILLSSNPKIVNNTLFIQGDKKYSDIQFDFPTDSIDSLVIIGGDLIIDQDVMSTNMIKPKWIIVMKNEVWKGGNIMVQKNTKKIQASIFTEWSLYSGDAVDRLYNDTTEKILTLPENQLYIKGTLISRNTIGWATQSDALCIYGEVSCDFIRAIRYDLNYFRLTPPNRNNTDTRSYSDNSLDAYSLIIERDPRISDTPPPGWEAR
jgi:hypothetical protein